MTEKLKGCISNTGIRGATPATFRDSFIKVMFESSCGYKEAYGRNRHQRKGDFRSTNHAACARTGAGF